jgi:hypothetical protein
MSLPLVLGITLDTLPATTPYVHVEQKAVTRWRGRIAGAGRRVGIVWQGRPTQRDDRKRSVTLPMLQPLFDAPGIVWVSLQKGEAARTAQCPGAACPPVDLTAELADFADTAALIASLDLVIAVDTAVAHLAGALGMPVWILLHRHADWRWHLDRPDSPWYPTARLFRQERPGEWSPVIANVRRALGEWLGASINHRTMAR